MSQASIKRDVKAAVKKALDVNKNLRAYLESKHLYGKFVKETTKKIEQDIERGQFYRTETRLKAIKDDISPINNALYWEGTKEGHTYWRQASIDYENGR